MMKRDLVQNNVTLNTCMKLYESKLIDECAGAMKDFETLQL